MGKPIGAPESLPDVGPAFAPGDRVAFFPVTLGPSSLWLSMEFAIIDELRPGEVFAFHFEGTPDEQHTQGLENVVRTSEHYFAWRAAVLAAYDRLGSIDTADNEPEVETLRQRVVAEHPIYGPDLRAALATSRDIPQP